MLEPAWSEELGSNRKSIKNPFCHRNSGIKLQNTDEVLRIRHYFIPALDARGITLPLGARLAQAATCIYQPGDTRISQEFIRTALHIPGNLVLQVATGLELFLGSQKGSFSAMCSPFIEQRARSREPGRSRGSGLEDRASPAAPPAPRAWKPRLEPRVRSRFGWDAVRSRWVAVRFSRGAVAVRFRRGSVATAIGGRDAEEQKAPPCAQRGSVSAGQGIPHRQHGEGGKEGRHMYHSLLFLGHRGL